MKYICTECHKEQPVNPDRYRCECGGLFSLSFDKTAPDFSQTAYAAERSLWKYANALPPIDQQIVHETTMGEGGTPLISLGTHLWGKADYYMPTLSFKDRGAVVLVAAMRGMGVRRCVIDSSGNAATAVAAYCTRVGIDCEVFVPAHTSAKKIEQIEAHGAVVHRIPGTREDTADAAIAHVEKTGAFYASHIFNPLFWEGTKTYLYELFEQFGGALPDLLVLPVGNGTLLMGVALALRELKEWGLVDRFPLVIAVQAANCAPLAAAYLAGSLVVHEVPSKPTLAEGIASARPARGAEILQAMHLMGGRFVTVSEEDILASRDALARKGVYVELTSAANHAGYLAALREDAQLGLLDAVVPLCGAGLKSAH
ncbi:MAG: threonine synthase [Spirochaetae bacterium HGW-Spirochaetae-4]|nr:MAG: threonine synthase [Spirochaetae bacterium HGW-Spirochaetae-4]